MIRIFFSLSILSFCLLSFSCAVGSSSKTTSLGRFVKDDDPQDSINQALALHDAGEIDAAVSKLRLLVDTKPYNKAHDRAYELIVEWLLQVKKRPEAKRVATYFLEHHKDSASAQKIIDLFDVQPEPENNMPAAPEEDITPLVPLEQSPPEGTELMEEQVSPESTKELLELEQSITNEPSAEGKAKKREALANYVLNQMPIHDVEIFAKKKIHLISYLPKAA